MDNGTTDTMKMPRSIAVAINEITGNVETIKKENDNDFDKYTFASIDDFMKYVNPLCAEAGLFIIQDEASKPELVEKPTKSGSTLMLWCEFNFTLGTTEGDLYGPIKRSVMVLATGAQAFGAAQSYALKQFLRSLFMIPTGDGDDPDNDATKAISAPPTIDAQKIAKSINAQISRSKNEKALGEVTTKYSDDLLLVKTASQTAYDFLMDAIIKRRDELNSFVDTSIKAENSNVG